MKIALNGTPKIGIFTRLNIGLQFLSIIFLEILKKYRNSLRTRLTLNKLESNLHQRLGETT